MSSTCVRATSGQLSWQIYDFDGRGSPIMAGPFGGSGHTCWPSERGTNGWKPMYGHIERQRFDSGECALLVESYLHRTSDDPTGLTFVRWEAKPGEILIVDSSHQVRAIQGRQDADFRLVRSGPSPSARHAGISTRSGARAVNNTRYEPSLRWLLDEELDKVVT